MALFLVYKYNISMTESTNTCPHCLGSKLLWNDKGEKASCRHCNGQGVISEQTFEIGQQVLWRYETNKGWGYANWFPAVIIKTGRKRVLIELKKKDGSKVQRWVSALNLKVN